MSRLTTSFRSLFRLHAVIALVLWCSLSAQLAAQELWFETGPLNPGLGPAPATLDRSTPMATMEALLALTDAGHYSEAAHLLDLSDVPQADQAVVGTERARLLAVLLERKVIMPWNVLADRPDGWLDGAKENGQTGRVRRSIVIDTFELGSRRVPLRVNRLKPGENAEAVWLIARQSVANIPALHAAYGPTKLEKRLPVSSIIGR